MKRVDILRRSISTNRSLIICNLDNNGRIDVRDSIVDRDYFDNRSAWNGILWDYTTTGDVKILQGNWVLSSIERSEEAGEYRAVFHIEQESGAYSGTATITWPFDTSTGKLYISA